MNLDEHNVRKWGIWTTNTELINEQWTRTMRETGIMHLNHQWWRRRQRQSYRDQQTSETAQMMPSRTAHTIEAISVMHTPPHNLSFHLLQQSPPEADPVSESPPQGFLFTMYRMSRNTNEANKMAVSTASVMAIIISQFCSSDSVAETRRDGLYPWRIQVRTRAAFWTKHLRTWDLSIPSPTVSGSRGKTSRRATLAVNRMNFKTRTLL